MAATRNGRHATAGAGAAVPLERFTLDNGLRVVIAPDRAAPVVGVNVSYDVGFRSEPEGRTGFAHLFEHVMFQGSANVGKMEHANLVQSAGGILNGSTHPDYTNYFEVLPSGALELALWLEADRMRSPRITEENLRNQIAVVQEEIRVNVLNQPYGGFPWISLTQAAFRSFANAHNGYGDFAELASVTVADAEDFFKRYYAPGNAVLCIAGDVDPDAARELVERHFGDIAKRRVPKRPSFAEPLPEEERRERLVDRLAPQPAVALGYRVPDPLKAFDDYLAHVLLSEILGDGDASRLQRSLVLDGRLASSVGVHLGTFGDPFDMRGPILLTMTVRHTPDVPVERITRDIDEQLERIANDGVEEEELARVLARTSTSMFQWWDGASSRTNALAVHELIYGNPGLLAELPARLAEVRPEQVQQAAGSLHPHERTLLELVPGTTR